MTIDEFLADLAKSLPSLVVLATVDGEERIPFVQGMADIEHERPATFDTAYGIGSVSKVFAALTVMRLIETGGFRLDDSVAALLGADDAPYLKDVTVHHLLTHASGLPPLDARFHALDRAEPELFTGGKGPAFLQPKEENPPPGHGFLDHRGLIEYLNSLDITRIGSPGERMSYSNEGYILLGGAVSEAMGERFEDVCLKLGVEQSGLEHTAFIPGDALADRATPYVRDGEKLKPVAWWDAPAWSAPGGMLSSARDLATFAELLRLSAPEAMTAEHVIYPPTEEHYGYGLLIKRAWDGRTMFGHEGGRAGTSASMLVIPEERACAVALSNVSGAQVGRAATAALATICGLSPDARPPSVADNAGNFEPDVHQLVRLARTYSAAEGATLRFVVSDGRLALAPSLKALSAVRRDWFAEPLVRFIGKGEEPPWGVHAGLRVMTREPVSRRRV